MDTSKQPQLIVIKFGISFLILSAVMLLLFSYFRQPENYPITIGIIFIINMLIYGGHTVFRWAEIRAKKKKEKQVSFKDL